MHWRTTSVFWTLMCLAQAGWGQGNPPQPFFFVQFADPQLEGAMETANFEYAVAVVNHLRPAFVVVCGDLVETTGDPWAIHEYFRILSKIDPDIPVYNVAGNHDVGNSPTMKSLESYRLRYGPDYFSFLSGALYGIVLDSSILHDPKGVPGDFANQESWLKTELVKARTNGAKHIVVFQHHPYFLDNIEEKDQYYNVPAETRRQYLEILRAAGVRYVFAGHTHRNIISHYRDLEIIGSAAISGNVDNAPSGFRIVIVRDGRLEHRYYPFGTFPSKIDPYKPLPGSVGSGAGNHPPQPAWMGLGLRCSVRYRLNGTPSTRIGALFSPKMQHFLFD